MGGILGFFDIPHDLSLCSRSWHRLEDCEINSTDKRTCFACGGPPGLIFSVEVLEFFGEEGDEFEEVDQAAVGGDGEDGGVGFGVDGDDDFAAAHAGEVLDGAVYAAGEVELRAGDFAGEADLLAGGLVAGIDGGAGGADGGVQFAGEFVDYGEVFFGFEGAAAGDDDIGFSEVFGFAAGGEGFDDAEGLVGFGEGDGEGVDVGGWAGGLFGDGV